MLMINQATQESKFTIGVSYTAVNNKEGRDEKKQGGREEGREERKVEGAMKNKKDTPPTSRSRTVRMVEEKQSNK